MEFKEIYVKSSLDGTDQPSLFYKAEGEGRPLLVGLHTWSFDRKNQKDNLLPLAKKHGFDLLLPEFRGPNLKTNPHLTKACGSEYAISDVVDAIEYVTRVYGSDKNKILLIGLSGGGHMALMMAGTHPELFLATAAFVPICDLSAWAKQNPNYAPHILACCLDSEDEMKKRSPVSYISGLAKSNTKIFHGKYDGCVPVTQSISLYNTLMEKYPKSRVFLDIFDGGHELDIAAAEYWLISQYEKKEKIAVTG